jgi:hypothetical protein
MTGDVTDSRSFSPRAFTAIIESLRDEEYRFRSYEEARPDARDIILRHDVDFSLEAAEEMARMEHGLGVKATYFVLLRTEFYNPLSARGLAALQKIRDYGHDIGLHLDASLYLGNSDEIDDAAEKECGLLAAAIDQSIDVISFHRPAPELIAKRELIAGRLSAYSPRFLKDMGYCSDSRGGWHYGPPLEQEAIKEGRALQLLFHPIWWRESGLPPGERLKEFLEDRCRFLEQEVKNQSSVARSKPDGSH